MYWLEFIENTALATGVELARLQRESRELRAIFAASYGTARRRQEEREKRPRSQGEEITRSFRITRSRDHQISPPPLPLLAEVINLPFLHVAIVFVERPREHV